MWLRHRHSLQQKERARDDALRGDARHRAPLAVDQDATRRLRLGWNVRNMFVTSDQPSNLMGRIFGHRPDMKLTHRHAR